MAWQFWIDRGGTFTDIVSVDPGGRVATAKLLSASPDYPDAAVEGIRRALGLVAGEPIPDGAIGEVRMGTTVATNALLERKGTPTLLLITKGFADLPVIGYQTRPDLFALNVVRPPRLAAEVIEVPERLSADGAVLVPLDEAHVRRDLIAARERGLTSVAIALMHSWLNPDHENRIADLARATGFTQVTTSHAASPLQRIVPRADTAVVDAYLSPILRTYVDRVSAALDIGRATGQLLFMQSSGGLTKASAFGGKEAVLSGPAGGIVGMVKTGIAAGYDKLIGFDMGGTSTDVSHYAGRYERSFETRLDGTYLRAPMMDIHTIAAGGGSICRYAEGRFQVGPESAGADPGPACYRRGGPLTITDCNLILGRIRPESFPAIFGPNADLPPDPEAALARMTEVTSGLGMTAEAAAEGFLAIATENMANAIRKISTARGYDLADYTLQAFGGAAGQLACRVADALAMRRVMISPFGGVLSAYGIGLAEVRVTRQAQLNAALGADEINAAVQLLQTETKAELTAQGARFDRHEVTAHLKHPGTEQNFALPFGPDLREAFLAAHKARFGFTTPDRPIEVEMVEVEAISDAPEPVFPDLPTGVIRGAAQADRAELGPGSEITGPALIAEALGTTVVDEGWTARVDEAGNLILTREAEATTTSDAADPVRLELFSNQMMSIAERMGVTLALTAQSVNIKERLDFSCAIFDAAGDLVANAPHVPVHLGSMSDAIREVIRRTKGKVSEGDHFALNAPYEGGTHLPDITVVTPVIWQGEPVMWLGARGHHADIGGMTPGSAPPDSRTLAEEGVVIDLMPLTPNGSFDEAGVRAVLTGARYPARNPDQNIADLKAQIAANETGRRELLDQIARIGPDEVAHWLVRVQSNAKEAVRSVIATLRPGSYTLPLDAEGRQISVAISIDKHDRSAVIDFAGTSPQDDGNYNAPLAISRAVALYVFRMLVGRPIPLNEGCLKSLDIRVPVGSMLNPGRDAAVIAGNTEVSQSVCNALIGALGVAGAAQGTMNNFIWGNADFQNYETIAGGIGAGPGFAGCDAVQSHMTNTRMTDPEVLETRFPVRLDRLAIRAGSGGVGEWRGGNGMIREVTFLAPVTVTTLSSSRRIAPFGAGGGGPGATGRNAVRRADGRIEELPGNAEALLQSGDSFIMETPGGGGWGKAL